MRWDSISEECWCECIVDGLAPPFNVDVQNPVLSLPVTRLCTVMRGFSNHCEIGCEILRYAKKSRIS